VILFVFGWFIRVDDAFFPPQIVFPTFATALLLAGWFNHKNRQDVWNGITISMLSTAMYFLVLSK
jgi:hypothetical protein